MQSIVNQARELKKWENIMKRESESTIEDAIDEDVEYSIQATISSSLWIYLYRCAKLGSRSLWKKKKNVIFEEQVRALCDKVIQHRLSRTRAEVEELNRKTNIPLRHDLVKGFCDTTDLMIHENPALYSDIALKLNITLQEERLVCKAFSDFADFLFSKGTTWPLVVSLLAFSGCLAAECAKHGRSILVRSISDWTTIFIVMRLRDWIIEHGKWDGFLSCFEPVNQSSSVISEKIIDDLILSYHTHEKMIHGSIVVLLVVLLMYFVCSKYSVFRT